MYPYCVTNEYKKCVSVNQQYSKAYNENEFQYIVYPFHLCFRWALYSFNVKLQLGTVLSCDKRLSIHLLTVKFFILSSAVDSKLVKEIAPDRDMPPPPLPPPLALVGTRYIARELCIA
jgi:hypothetical protein